MRIVRPGRIGGERVRRCCQSAAKSAKSSRVSALMPPAAVGLQGYIAGSSSQSPEASVQGVIAGGDGPEVAILIECGVVREVGR